MMQRTTLVSHHLIKVLTVLKQQLLRLQIHQKEIVTVCVISFIKHINGLVFSRVVTKLFIYTSATYTSEIYPPQHQKSRTEPGNQKTILAAVRFSEIKGIFH